MCLLELAATSNDDLYDEAVQIEVTHGTYQLLVTPLRQALRPSMPDLKICTPTKIADATGFVAQLVKPLSKLTPELAADIAAGEVERTVEKTAEKLDDIAEPVDKPEQC